MARAAQQPKRLGPNLAVTTIATNFSELRRAGFAADGFDANGVALAAAVPDLNRIRDLIDAEIGSDKNAAIGLDVRKQFGDVL